MVRFIDDHRIHYGVEPICRVLPIAELSARTFWNFVREFSSFQAVIRK
jgi:hypothetical protein